MNNYEKNLMIRNAPMASGAVLSILTPHPNPLPVEGRGGGDPIREEAPRQNETRPEP
jgi:hypothetical protein